MLTRWYARTSQLIRPDNLLLNDEVDTEVVLINDILPLLREARYLAQFIVLNDTNPVCVGRAKALLDTTAAIEEEKGVEG